MKSLGPVDPGTSDLVVVGLRSWLAARLPGTVSAYLPLSDEVDVTPLFEALPGWRWVLPRVEVDGSLTFRDRDLLRERHELGMSQPVASGEMVPVPQIDVFLVPGLAFDSSGARLGRGRAYYDGVLAERRTDSTAIGVTVAERVVAEVPVEPHDRTVDLLATEAGIIDCSSRI